jgi:hypothetical protein
MSNVVTIIAEDVNMGHITMHTGEIKVSDTKKYIGKYDPRNNESTKLTDATPFMIS